MLPEFVAVPKLGEREILLVDFLADVRTSKIASRDVMLWHNKNRHIQAV